MSDMIVKFPASKRKFTEQEERELANCIQKITSLYDGYVIGSTSYKKAQTEQAIRKFAKKLLEMNEE